MQLQRSMCSSCHGQQRWRLQLVTVLLVLAVCHSAAVQLKAHAQPTDRGPHQGPWQRMVLPWKPWRQQHKQEDQQQHAVLLGNAQHIHHNRRQQQQQQEQREQLQQPAQQQPAQQQQQHASWLRRLLGNVKFPGPNDPTLKPDAGMPKHFQEKWFEVLQQQWQDHNKAMQAVRVGNSTLAELAAPLLLHNVTLANPAQLKRAIGHMGPMHRLRRVLRGLQTGKTIKLGVLGGSISWGSAVERGEDDWFALVTRHLGQAFPAANVSGRNGCVPATPSSFMNMCLENYMEEDVDLVFVEYATNDGWDIHNVIKKKTYERLLRKILSKPKQPAVVLVQLPTVGMGFAAHHKNKTPFYKTVEDVYGAFAAYYDLPYLSMRNAIWRLAELHHYQMNFTHYYGLTYDFIHPLEQGHRLVADMVLFALQQGFVDLQLNPWSMWDEEEAAAPLPKPMYWGNWEEANRLCTNGKAFESVVGQAKGWAMVNEGDEFKPKFGYVTRQVGAELVLTINTTRSTAPELERMNVQLAYLRSYRGMGMALVRCHGGCECQDTLVNGHHELKQSTIFLLRLYPTQAPACSISVTVQSDTHSDGHKFKVTGVMANEFRNHGDAAESQAHEALNQEEWLGGVNKGEGELKERWSKAAKAERQQPHKYHSSSSSSSSSSGAINSNSSSSSQGLRLPIAGDSASLSSVKTSTD